MAGRAERWPCTAAVAELGGRYRRARGGQAPPLLCQDITGPCGHLWRPVRAGGKIAVALVSGRPYSATTTPFPTPGGALSTRGRVTCLFLASAAVGWLASACGGGATEPDPETFAKSYLGVLAVNGADGLGGVFQVSTTGTGGGQLARTSLQSRWANLADALVPPLWAQASTPVSGVLMTNAGEVVPLAGTLSGGSVTVSGGGYSINAAAGASGGLVGTGTAPGGLAAAVTAPPIPPVTAPAPADPSGTYTGTFQMTTTLRHRNTAPSGQVVAACNVPVVISGTATLDIERLSNGQLESHLETQWSEIAQGTGTCPAGYTYSMNFFSGLDFIGSAGSLITGRVLTSGGVTRTEAFTGAVSGNTVVGTIFRSFQYTVPVTGAIHVEGFPNVSAAMTLTRQ